MSVRRTFAVALTGVTGHIVTVEAAATAQLPGIAVIGLPDAALAEAKQRIRVACHSSAFKLAPRMITINLSPADMPKHGSGFDLAMALTALAASNALAQHHLASTVHIGELGLDGTVKRTPGLLPAVQAAKRSGYPRVMVALEALPEARLVAGIDVVGVRSLAEAVAWHRGETLEFTDSPSGSPSTLRHVLGAQDELEMADVVGHDEIVEALTVAAVGGHNLAMVGSPGTGKSMLAMRLPSILPDLTDEEAVRVTSVASLQTSQPFRELIRRPPLQAPHHSITLGAMVGVGTRSFSPGAVSRASEGVLFLDEAPEFSSRVLEALRQPLESGEISVQRSSLAVTMPARFMLVLASNPCPCGYANSVTTSCTCQPQVLRRYRNRVSGPIRDRLDIRLRVENIAIEQATGTRALQSATSSAALRMQVSEARERTRRRLQRTPWHLNSQVSGAWMRDADNAAPAKETALLDTALQSGRLSMRGYDRVLRVAWSFADLLGDSKLTSTHIGKALTLRDEAHW